MKKLNYNMTFNLFINDGQSCEEGNSWRVTFNDGKVLNYPRKGHFITKFQQMFKQNLPNKIELINASTDRLVQCIELTNEYELNTCQK